MSYCVTPCYFLVRNTFAKVHKKFFFSFLDLKFHSIPVSQTNQISLCFGVPDNQISFHLDVPDKQISLRLNVPDNCSRKQMPGLEQRSCGFYRRNSRLAQETGQNTEHKTEFQGRWVYLSKTRWGRPR